ncbi:3029_t:CDS:2, partial [Racocetra fulgida]
MTTSEFESLTKTDQFELISKESPNEEISMSNEIVSVSSDNTNNSQKSTNKPRKRANNLQKNQVKHIQNCVSVRDYLKELDDGSNECKANMIIKLLKEIGIGKKLLGVTTNNAVNMLVIGHILKEKMNNKFSNPDIQYFCCGTHVLNIVVEEEMKSINKEISKARDFSKKLRNSPSLIRELKKIFELKNIPFLMPETD